MKAMIGMKEGVGPVKAMQVDRLETAPPWQGPKDVLASWSKTPQQLLSLLNAGSAAVLSMDAIRFRDGQTADEARFGGAIEFESEAALLDAAAAAGCEFTALYEEPFGWICSQPWSEAERELALRVQMTLHRAAALLECATRVFELSSEDLGGPAGSGAYSGRRDAREVVALARRQLLEGREPAASAALAVLGVAGEDASNFIRPLDDALVRAARPRERIAATAAALKESSVRSEAIRKALEERCLSGLQSESNATEASNAGGQRATIEGGISPSPEALEAVEAGA